MASPLLVNSESFRKKIIVKNLVPYPKSPSRITPPIDYDTTLSDSAVIDSPDVLIDEPRFAQQLYKNNQYGAEGGYKQVPDPGSLNGTKSNEGEYGYQDANILDQAPIEAKRWKSVNAYSFPNDVTDAGEYIATLETVQLNSNRTTNGQPYPSTFNPSSYNPVSILLSPDPLGSDGLLSSDSYIARLGATILRKEFETRIGREIIQRTRGRVNIFNVRSGTDVLNLLTGRVPVIEPNYQITVPAGPILAATDFALRLAGSIIPVSPIPGSYFDPSIQIGQPTTIQQIGNAFRRSTTGKFFNRLLGGTKTGSQIFLENTGGGQKSRLFGNLDYNRYKPGYDRSIFDRLGGAIVGTNTNNSNYYIGSITSEPSRVFSPGGDLPVDNFARELQSPVYGPQELAQLYEGPSREVKLGANGPTYSDGGGIEGGFTWVSPKYRANAGKKVGIGGEILDIDENFRPSSYVNTESNNLQFREGSILDDTQKLIDSQPAGGRRLQHVGNAIDQVSKVFNDGYKELTKGSRVIKYTGAIGQERGVEYCRVFAKDIPYLNYTNLQKTEGITTQNRKISYSVLDSTYNLNIYPNRKDGTADSTNLVGNPDTDGHVKKYMFSLENLAWRSSSKPGFTYSDLPVCERGPNGGRIMWFPPYGLTFSESTNASWKDSSFIGRPEPIYTYSNTSRGGSLSWKIVVDHPSVLNLVVNKVLNNETNRDKINSLLESFFAGCVKYDLYELAKRYPLANPNDLYVIQTELDSKQLTKEQVDWIKRDVQTGVNTSSNANNPKKANPSLSVEPIQNDLKGQGFYFDNDIPKGNVVSYTDYYNLYEKQEPTYIKEAPNQTTPYLSNSSTVQTFFTEVIKSNYSQIKVQLDKIYEKYSEIDSINFTLLGTASAPASVAYNKSLSERRNDSVKKFILGYKSAGGTQTLENLIGVGKITFTDSAAKGEEATVTTKMISKSSEPFDCTKDTKDSQAASKKIYTVNAMACRRVLISDVKITLKQQGITNTQPENTQPQVTTTTESVQQVTKQTTTENVEVQRTRLADNLSKRVLRLLLTECDYFESIKEDTPMVFDNLKDKLKFFHPAFHSTTPEGLNSRLTFLNQCMRPGDTIPTVKSVNGKQVLDYSNAVNTAFGTPPVLVLRVGDFYNTKIIPESLQLQYENLDLNPEGIGVQPMIANVTLSFKFVGGSGIKDAVDKIQNALTFNYYANTEVYDDRAEATDTESLASLDAEFASLYGQQAPPTQNQVQNNQTQSNSSTIGNIIQSFPSESGTTGTISYTKFMSDFVEGTQNYFRDIMNKNKETLAQYNESIRQQATLGRNFTKGEIIIGSGVDTFLYGKPSVIQKKVDLIFQKYISDINSDQDVFLRYMEEKNFTKKVLRTLKNNYKDTVNRKKSTFLNSVFTIIQGLTNQQTTYNNLIARYNIITYGTPSTTGSDGYQPKDKDPIVYYTTGATTLEGLTTDGVKIKTSLNGYLAKLNDKYTFTFDGKPYNNFVILPETGENSVTENDTFRPIGTSIDFNSQNFRREYTILSTDVTDNKKYETFKNEMIGNILSNSSLLEDVNKDLEKEFDAYWIGRAKPSFEKQNKAALEFLNYMETNQLQNFINFVAVEKTKTREMSFTNVPGNTTEDNLMNNRKKLINSLILPGTNTNNQTFNDSQGPIVITKTKFN
jgi:outer membrane protein OmpA-like peptidoglycan-associated protein